MIRSTNFHSCSIINQPNLWKCFRFFISLTCRDFMSKRICKDNSWHCEFITMKKNWRKLVRFFNFFPYLRGLFHDLWQVISRKPDKKSLCTRCYKFDMIKVNIFSINNQGNFEYTNWIHKIFIRSVCSTFPIEI